MLNIKAEIGFNLNFLLLWRMSQFLNMEHLRKQLVDQIQKPLGEKTGRR